MNEEQNQEQQPVLENHVGEERFSRSENASPRVKKHILKGWESLKATMNGSAVAEYFHSVGFPLGPHSRNMKRDGTKAVPTTV